MRTDSNGDPGLAGHRGEQSSGVFVLRIGEHLVGVALLDDRAGETSRPRGGQGACRPNETTKAAQRKLDTEPGGGRGWSAYATTS